MKISPQPQKPVTPWLVLGGVSLAASTGLALRALSLGTPCRAIMPLHISNLGIGIALGGLVRARKKRLIYEGSLAFTKATNRVKGHEWWNELAGYNIVLGGIPLNDKNHLESITNLGVTAVLACVEPFELEAGWINTPVTLEMWGKAKINANRIEAADFLPMSQDNIKEGVAYLHGQISQNGKVYVHCKGGRGRSATVAIAYLVEHENIGLQEAFNLVKKARPQIHLNPSQMGALNTYANSLKG